MKYSATHEIVGGIHRLGKPISGLFARFRRVKNHPESPLAVMLPLDRYREPFHEINDGDLAVEREEDNVFAEKDLFVTTDTRRSRYLNFYTKYGLELAFERYGLLDRLRAKGYRKLRIDMDLNDCAGDTIRVLEDEPTAQPLVEIRLRRDRKTIRGMELLAVEWLLTQDLQAEFTADKPRLPGQEYPGLGMLRGLFALFG